MVIIMTKLKEILFLKSLNRVGKAAIYGKYWDMLNDADDFYDLVSEVEGVDVAGKKNALAKLRDISLRIMELTGRVPSMLIQTLQDQIVQMKKSGLSEATNYIEKTNEAIKTHTLLRLGGQIKQNSKWLSTALTIIDKLSDYESLFASLPVIPGVTDEINRVLKLAESPKEKITIIEKMVGKINDTSSKEKIKKYIETKIEGCSSAQLDFDEQTEFYSTFELIKEEYNRIAYSISSANEMTEVMKLIPAIDRNLSIFLTLSGIRKLLPGYDSTRSDYEKKKKDNDKKRKEGFYALHESERNKDEAEEDERKKRCATVSANITKQIDALYEIFARGTEKDLLKTLEISLKESQGQFTQASLLALLMTGTNIPVSRFDNLLERNEQSVRREHRNLKKQLESHRLELINYAEGHKTSIAILLLKLLDSSANE